MVSYYFTIIQFAAMVLAQLYYTFIEVEHSYVNKHHYRWNAANESSAIKLYT